MKTTMTFKETLIYLQSQGCSYHFLFEFFKLGVSQQSANAQFDVHSLLDLIEKTGRVIGGRRIKRPDKRPLLQNFASHTMRVQKLAHKAFMIGDACYPLNWLELAQPPILIFFEGDLGCLKKPCISVVGTRDISPYGREIVQQLVTEFADQNWVSVSGLAKGVDTAVHLAASQRRPASTIAILANGFDYTYPHENVNLQAEMSMTQLLLSEYLPSEKARRHQFVMRNRLVAGLSFVTVVIEAAKRSGSLITANYALQNNRELYVLPGRITDAPSYGCNSLIQHGAIPIVSVAECVADLRELFRNTGVE